MIRSFDWRDFPSLHRNRNDGIWLDTSLALTRWMGLVPAGALLATFAPATGIFTYVTDSEDANGDQIVGQFFLSPGRSNARLTFISPEELVESPAVFRLLDYLAARAGDRGALNLLAEVNERSAAYEVLRLAGYAIYARQRVWDLSQSKKISNLFWRQVKEKDEYHVHYLYNSLVPALVQQTEPPPWENMSGLIFEHEGEVLGYVHLSYGPKGILAQPIVHPDTDHAEELLASIFAAVPNVRSRPVYLCVRSHQAWLTPFLEDMDLEAGPHQAVMVKRLVVSLKEPARQAKKAGIENVQPETSTYSIVEENGKSETQSPSRPIESLL